MFLIVGDRIRSIRNVTEYRDIHISMHIHEPDKE